MQIPEPVQEHRWLQQLVGEWDYEHECQMGPEQAPVKSTGKQSTRTLGELWVIGEIVGELPSGGEARSIITLGFDPQSKRFVGTFVSSCMTHLWPYNGSLDETNSILTLDSDGPSFAGDGTMAKYQDIIQVIDQNHHTMSSQFLSPDGQWVPFMLGHYRRSSTVGES